MRDARKAIQEIEDAGPLPRIAVENYAAVWDGDLGFAYHVEPGKGAAFARKLRMLADAIERWADEPEDPPAIVR